MYKNKWEYILGYLYTFVLQLQSNLEMSRTVTLFYCHVVLLHVACIQLELQAVHHVN